MLLESESQGLRDRKLRIKTTTEGNLLLILLVRKLRMNTGFYTAKSPRKTRAKCLKHKNRKPEKCKKGTERKAKTRHKDGSTRKQ